jgi:hypothetical protein
MISSLFTSTKEYSPLTLFSPDEVSLQASTFSPRSTLNFTALVCRETQPQAECIGAKGESPCSRPAICAASRPVTLGNIPTTIDGRLQPYKLLALRDYHRLMATSTLSQTTLQTNLSTQDLSVIGRYIYLAHAPSVLRVQNGIYTAAPGYLIGQWGRTSSGFTYAAQHAPYLA